MVHIDFISAADEEHQQQEFIRLSKRKSSWQNRFYVTALFAACTYSFFFGTVGTFGSASGSTTRDAFGTATLACLAVAYLAGRSSRKYRLTIEENGFLDAYRAKQAMQAFSRDPTQDKKRKEAISHLTIAIRGIPIANVRSTLATRALTGTQDLRRFIRKKLLVYLENPASPQKTVDSISILCQFLLNPTVDSISPTLRYLNDTLPDELFQPQTSLTSKMGSLLWGTVERIPTLIALAIATLVAVLIIVVGDLVFKALPEGFFTGVIVGSYVFYEQRKDFKNRISPTNDDAGG